MTEGRPTGWLSAADRRRGPKDVVPELGATVEVVGVEKRPEGVGDGMLVGVLLSRLESIRPERCYVEVVVSAEECDFLLKVRPEQIRSLPDEAT